MMRLLRRLNVCGSTPAFPRASGDPGLHLLQAAGWARVTGAADEILQSGRREILGPAQDDRITVVLDDQLHTRDPAVTLTNLFRDDELSLGGKVGHFRPSCRL